MGFKFSHRKGHFYGSVWPTENTIRYDTIRWRIFTCPQKLANSQLNLPHGTKQKRLTKKLKIKTGSEREMYLWMVRVVSWDSKKMWQEHEQASQRQRDWMRVTERTRKLIPETWWGIPEGAISYAERGWGWWSSEDNVIWGTSVARRLNKDEVMKIRRLGGCEDFVSEWEESVFNAFGYFEPMKRA